MEIELKKCPACGSPAKPVEERNVPKPFYVGCSNVDGCPVWPVTRSFATAEEAAKAWAADQTL